ncbi:hypothetical protein CGRA01v4_08046 [Colletotrichum graminicola]|nr:hypothetical protein CGRA01v4_08046 [Colletotrichum graminicola]
MDLDMDESRTSVSLEFTPLSRLNGTGDGHASQRTRARLCGHLLSLSLFFLFFFPPPSFLPFSRGRGRNVTPAWDLAGHT